MTKSKKNRQIFKGNHIKLLVFVCVVFTGAAVVFYSDYQQYFNMDRIKENISNMRDFVNTHYIASVLIYILTFTLLNLIFPLAFVMTLAGGLLYGVLEASLYAVTATGCSASVTFLFSRYFAGLWIQERFEERLETFNTNMETYGVWYLLLIRIIAVAPFCILNLIAGFTKVRFSTFLWTTCLGSLPNILILTILANTVWLI